MVRVMQGVRVLEVAQFVFAPATGAILADWGADVIKIEHPVHGDPQRGYLSWPPSAFEADHNPLIEGPNRGKRSVGLDLSNPAGRALLYELAATADVFLTNFLPAARQKLAIDLEHIRAANPKIIYARAGAYGDKGEDRDRGGFDGTVFWFHSGMAQAMSPPELGAPLAMNLGGFGDMISGMNLAGGISAALFHRAQTGEPTEVDVSLLSSAWWAAGSTVNVAAETGKTTPPRMPRSGGVPGNPFIGNYKTSDGGAIGLYFMQPGPLIRDTFEHVGRPELADDPRFADAAALASNSEAASQCLTQAFAERPLDYWRSRLKTLSGQWAVAQTIVDLISDPQTQANDMLFEVETLAGAPLRLARGPVQFNREPTQTTRAPRASEHTDSVLGELGLRPDRIAALKANRIIG